MNGFGEEGCTCDIGFGGECEACAEKHQAERERERDDRYRQSLAALPPPPVKEPPQRPCRWCQKQTASEVCDACHALRCALSTRQTHAVLNLLHGQFPLVIGAINAESKAVIDGVRNELAAVRRERDAWQRRAGILDVRVGNLREALSDVLRDEAALRDGLVTADQFRATLEHAVAVTLADKKAP